MAKATLSRIMKRGHEIARTLEGNYQARLAYGLKVAWAEYKGGKKVEKTILTGSEKQAKWAEDIKEDILKGLEELSRLGHNVEGAAQKINSITNAKIFIDNRENYKELLPIIVKGVSTNRKEVEGKIVSFFWHPRRGIMAVNVGEGPWEKEMIIAKNITEIR